MDFSPAPTRAARECRPTTTPELSSANTDGTMTTIAGELDQPTSLEIGNAA
jgi:hypothetical protein